MNLQKYTEKAQEAVLNARELAENANNSQIEPLHLLSALVEQPEGVVPQVLSRIGVDTGTLANMVRTEIGRLPQVHGNGGQVYLSPALNDAAKRAENIAASIKDEYVSTE